MNTLKGMREEQRGVLSSLYEIEGLVKKKKKKKKWFIF
jgi:hypothetical protein